MRAGIHRRDAEDDDVTIMDCDANSEHLCPRYDKQNPVRGLQQIVKVLIFKFKSYIENVKNFHCESLSKFRDIKNGVHDISRNVGSKVAAIRLQLKF